MEPIVGDLWDIDENSIIDGIGHSSEVSRIRLWINSQAKLFKSKNRVRPSLAKSQLLIQPSFGLGFLTPRTRLELAQLRQAFIKVPIFYHFDSKCYIGVETNASGYAFSGILSQLTLDDQSLLHPIAFFFRKMISAEIWYETYNGKLLVIVKAFKT